MNRIIRAALVAAASTLLLTAGAAPALASPVASTQPAPAETGWVRLAHFSPDTPAVDVRLTAFDGAGVIALSNVGYGDISDYDRVPIGTYTASMVPPGAPAGTEPVITQAVTVEPGRAYTVAAVGPNAELTGTVLNDDLTPPQEGSARIRLVQASIAASEVTVQAQGGPVIADNARFGTATGYAEIPAGVWTLDLTGSAGARGVTTLEVGPGTVTTLAVLDRDGALTIAPIVDSAGVGQMPTGGVQTGAGGTAGGFPVLLPGVAVVLVALLAVLVGRTVVRRRAVS